MEICLGNISVNLSRDYIKGESCDSPLPKHKVHYGHKTILIPTGPTKAKSPTFLENGKSRYILLRKVQTATA